MKTIKILLKPVFKGKKITSALGQTILINVPPISAGDTIVGMYTKHGMMPTQCYDDLKGEDESGALNLSWKDSGPDNNIRQWTADRDTKGRVTFFWETFPRKVTSKTMPGPRSDTRVDSGGLEFGGLSTIPIPWEDAQASKDVYRKIIEWDLESAIPGTRAVSSYGEGPQPLEKIGRLQDMGMTFFMVGPIISFPPLGEESRYPHFGYYWFGDDTPEKITSLGEFLAGLFSKMSNFFKDPPSATNGYYIFVRCASPAQAHGGVGGERSFLLEYDENLPSISSQSVLNLLSHEMVHNWPILDADPFTSDPNGLVQWFNEGVADYYGSTLPYRFGLVSKEDYLAQMNSIFSSYYTNPLRNISDKDSQEQKWEAGDALEIPYKRGFTFLCVLDSEIRRNTPGKSLDDIVIEICRRKKYGEPHDLPVLLKMIQDAAPNMIKQHKEMQSGKLVIPPDDALGPEFKLVKEEHEMFDLGFPESALVGRKVDDLADDSRAKKAGLKKGDEILKNTFLWQCRGGLDQKMKMTIKRDGEEKEISYWPRSFDKTECWQFKEKDESKEKP